MASDGLIARVRIIKDGKTVSVRHLESWDDEILELYNACKKPLIQERYIDEPGTITIHQEEYNIHMTFEGFAPETKAFLETVFSRHL